jgi:hypothetical protein
MPSVFSHAVASIGISACFYRRGVPTSVDCWSVLFRNS